MTKNKAVKGFSLFFLTSSPKKEKRNKVDMEPRLIFIIYPLLLLGMNISGEVLKDGWQIDGQEWVFSGKITSEISVLSDTPNSKTIKFNTNLKNKHILESLQEQLTENRRDFLEYIISNENENVYELLISFTKNTKYKVERKNDEIFIRVSQVDREKISSALCDLTNSLKELAVQGKKNEDLQDDTILNSLNNSLSRIKEMNEIKIAKYLSGESKLIISPETLAQPIQDRSGTQSLSVGNIGFQEKKIEIREAEPVEEPQPKAQEISVENQTNNIETQAPVPTSPPAQEKTTQEQIQTTMPQEGVVVEGEQGPTPPPPRETTPEQATDATAEITRELRALMETEEEEPQKPSAPVQEIPQTQPQVSSIESKTSAPSPQQIQPQSPSEMIKPSPKGLDTIIDFECEKMPLSKLVPLLAYKAGINVVAGTDLKGDVTMSLKKVTLRKAIEAALRMNGLGLIQEENIYRIVPYEEAIASDRTTTVVKLENAKASEVRKVLEEISKGTKGSEYVTISANDTTNVVIVAGPEEFVQALSQMARELDIAKPVIPTVTTTIKLNYADPEELAKSIQKILTPKTGNVSADSRARHIIVTDMPVVVEQVKEIVKSLDVPVKQVLIDSMVVDATLNDEALTGIDWLIKAVRHQSWRDFVMYGPDGRKIGNLQQLELGGRTITGQTIGSLTFSLLTNEIDWKGVIQAEVRNGNGHLVSNPVVATVENKPATITISQEIPYIDLTQTSQGGALTNTRFKQVGTVLEVTPRVTHDNHIIVDIKGKESVIVGEFNGVPIEDLRQVTSTLHINSGQTIFVGGLRKRNDSATIKKIPVLGNIPILNVAFKTNQRKAQVNELLIFLTCSVIDQELPELTPEQKEVYETGKNAPMKTDMEKYLGHDILKPNESFLPPYKWKKATKKTENVK